MHASGGDIGTVFGAAAAKVPPPARPNVSAFTSQLTLRQGSQPAATDKHASAAGEGRPDAVAANLETFVPLTAPATTVKLKEALGPLSVAAVLRNALQL